VAYTPVTKRWLCKQRTLLGNAHNIHAPSNRKGLCNPFLSIGSVNTFPGNDVRSIARQPPITTIEELLEGVFSVGSAPRVYSEDCRPAERQFR
jgi:hypothetical protein